MGSADPIIFSLLDVAIKVHGTDDWVDVPYALSSQYVPNGDKGQLIVTGSKVSVPLMDALLGRQCKSEDNVDSVVLFPGGRTESPFVSVRLQARAIQRTGEADVVSYYIYRAHCDDPYTPLLSLSAGRVTESVLSFICLMSESDENGNNLDEPSIGRVDIPTKAIKDTMDLGDYAHILNDKELQREVEEQ
jgi:hypothetical protein